MNNLFSPFRTDGWALFHFVFLSCVRLWNKREMEIEFGEGFDLIVDIFLHLYFLCSAPWKILESVP